MTVVASFANTIPGSSEGESNNQIIEFAFLTSGRDAVHEVKSSSVGLRIYLMELSLGIRFRW